MPTELEIRQKVRTILRRLGDSARLKVTEAERRIVDHYVEACRRAGYYITTTWEKRQYSLFRRKRGNKSILVWQECIDWCLSGGSKYWGTQRPMSSITLVCQAMNDYLTWKRTHVRQAEGKIRSKYKGVGNG